MLLVVNGPGIGTHLFFCSVEAGLRTCGDTDFGAVLTERRDGQQSIRSWSPSGVEYFREIIDQHEHRVLYRAVLPCWFGVSEHGAHGLPSGMESARCENGSGLGKIEQ